MRRKYSLHRIMKKVPGTFFGVVVWNVVIKMKALKSHAFVGRCYQRNRYLYQVKKSFSKTTAVQSHLIYIWFSSKKKKRKRRTKKLWVTPSYLLLFFLSFGTVESRRNWILDSRQITGILFQSGSLRKIWIRTTGGLSRKLPFLCKTSFWNKKR